MNKVVIDAFSVINYSVELTHSRTTFLHTWERNITVVSNVLTPAQHLTNSEDTSLHTLEGNLTVVSNVLTPAQHLTNLEDTCLHTLEGSPTVVSNVLVISKGKSDIRVHDIQTVIRIYFPSAVSNVLTLAQHPIASENTCLHTV